MKKIIMGILIMFVMQSSLYAEVPTRDNVSKLYVATFNRAPDTAGLNYWVNDSRLSLEGIALSFFEQPETKTLYPSSTANRDFIKSVYANLFNREPDTAGWDYWEGQLNSGAIPKSIFILAVINGALGSDAVILSNKTTVGLAFANAGLNDVAQAKVVMQDVTADQQSVDDALEIISDGIGPITLYALSNSEYPKVPFVIKSVDNNSALVFHTNEGHTRNSVTYTTDDGEMLTLRVDSSGYLLTASTDEIMFIFTNYTSHSVGVSILSIDGALLIEYYTYEFSSATKTLLTGSAKASSALSFSVKGVGSESLLVFEDVLGYGSRVITFFSNVVDATKETDIFKALSTARRAQIATVITKQALKYILKAESESINLATDIVDVGLETANCLSGSPTSLVSCASIAYGTALNLTTLTNIVIDIIEDKQRLDALALSLEANIKGVLDASQLALEEDAVLREEVDNTPVEYDVELLRLYCAESEKLEGDQCVAKTCAGDAYGCLECLEHEKIEDGQCVAKTCEVDEYNCPTCGVGEDLYYYTDGSGYCNVAETNKCPIIVYNLVSDNPVEGSTTIEFYSSHGKRITDCMYDASGTLWHEVPYVDWKKEGLEIYYYESGEIKHKIPYINGVQEGLEIYYYETGVIKQETLYDNGVRDGIERYNYETNLPEKEITYVNGVRHGPTKLYYTSGDLKWEYPFVDGLVQGLAIMYYITGEINLETPFVDSQMHGYAYSYIYTDDGVVQSCSDYFDGLLIGNC